MSTHQHRNHERAFTLIELMTVIAIVGILSTVAGVSLGNARDGARDKSATADIQSIAIESALYRGQSGGNYTGLCSSANVVNLLERAEDTTVLDAGCRSNATSYAAWVALRNGGFYCVDSTKNYGPRASAPGGTSC